MYGWSGRRSRLLREGGSWGGGQPPPASTDSAAGGRGGPAAACRTPAALLAFAGLLGLGGGLAARPTGGGSRPISGRAFRPQSKGTGGAAAGQGALRASGVCGNSRRHACGPLTQGEQGPETPQPRITQVHEAGHIPRPSRLGPGRPRCANTESGVVHHHRPWRQGVGGVVLATQQRHDVVGGAGGAVADDQRVAVPRRHTQNTCADKCLDQARYSHDARAAQPRSHGLQVTTGNDEVQRSCAGGRLVPPVSGLAVRAAVGGAPEAQGAEFPISAGEQPTVLRHERRVLHAQRHFRHCLLTSEAPHEFWHVAVVGVAQPQLPRGVAAPRQHGLVLRQRSSVRVTTRHHAHPHTARSVQLASAPPPPRRG